MQSYKILNNTKLKEYKMIGAHLVYLFYLTLKYKKPDEYYEIFIKKSQSGDVITRLQNEFYFDKREAQYVNDSLSALDNDDKLKDMSMSLNDSDNFPHANLRIIDINNDEVRIYGDYRTLKINSFSNWGGTLILS